MLIKKEQILSDSDPLFLTCHPLGKIQFITNVFLENPDPGQSNTMAAMEILEDAKAEIEFIIDACNERWAKDHAELERLRKENAGLKEQLSQHNRLDTEVAPSIESPRRPAPCRKVCPCPVHA